MVPLPVQAQVLAGKVITLHDGCHRLSAYQRSHAQGYPTFLIAQHGPSVNPSTGHQREHTSHTAAVLENDAIPIAILSVDNGALPHMRESTEICFQNSLLLVWSVNVVGPVAHLPSMPSGRKHVRNHQQIVFPVVLYHSAALQKSSFIAFALKQLAVRAFHHFLQVGCQFAHTSCLIHHIHPIVIVEEQ